MVAGATTACGGAATGAGARRGDDAEGKGKKQGHGEARHLTRSAGEGSERPEKARRRRNRRDGARPEPGKTGSRWRPAASSARFRLQGGAREDGGAGGGVAGAREGLWRRRRATAGDLGFRCCEMQREREQGRGGESEEEEEGCTTQIGRAHV